MTTIDLSGWSPEQRRAWFAAVAQHPGPAEHVRRQGDTPGAIIRVLAAAMHDTDGRRSVDIDLGALSRRALSSLLGTVRDLRRLQPPGVDPLRPLEAAIRAVDAERFPGASGRLVADI